MKFITPYVKLLRPAQWVKNIFVWLPLFFSGNVLQDTYFESTLWAFVAFCLLSSAIYCFNDIMDVAADREHPVKRRRPLASGQMSRGAAVTEMLLLLAAVMAIAVRQFASIPAAWIILAVYLALNLGYSLGLKRIPIVDVFIIALGFVLRLAMGGVVCGIWLSPWIVCLTFLLTLTLAFAKRRDDLLLYKQRGKELRRSVRDYNLPYMDQVLGLLGAITMVCYIIYSVSPDVESRMGSHYVYISSIFVLAGILRYLQITLVHEQSGSPTRTFLTDGFLLTCMACWVAFFVVLLYV